MKRRSIIASAAFWCAAAFALLAAAVPAWAQSVHVAVTPAMLQVSPGAVFYLDITVTQAGSPFNGFDAVIGYDPAALTLLPLSPTSMQQGSLMTGACGNTFHLFRQGASSDTITDVLLCAGVSLTGPGQIYRLRFQASSTVQQTVVRFLPEARFYNAGYNVLPVYTADAIIGIGMAPVTGVDAPVPDLGIALDVMPNPARGEAAFRIDAGSPEPCRVLVISVEGRIVRRFEAAGSGPREIAWDGRDDRGRLASAGVYFVRVEAAGRAATKRLTLAR